MQANSNAERMKQIEPYLTLSTNAEIERLKNIEQLTLSNDKALM